MNIKFNYFLVIALIFTITIVMLVRNNLSSTDKLRLDELKIVQLQKNIDLLEKENTVLTVKLSNTAEKKVVKVEPIVNNNSESENNAEAITENDMLDTKLAAQADSMPAEDYLAANAAAINAPAPVDGFVDINKPFNGIDPASETQQEIYSSFKYEIDGYNFNERFDFRGFLSDARFGQLHASLGAKLLDYVDQKLVGIKLLQDSNPDALTQAELSD